jgi:2-(1,2-epoxy-1,2-dihydrophenyl)acetyl-CoA isomerase
MTIRVDQPEPRVRRILLDRPEARNAIDDAVRQALHDAVIDAIADEGVRAILIAGAGGVFSGGGDLPSLVGLDEEGARDRLRSGHRIVSALWTCPKPVAVAVERFAVGAAAGLALLADEIVMGRNATFSFPFLRLGLIPDWGLAATLPLRAGPVAAARLLRDGQPVGADEALALGLADRVVADDETMAEAVAAAARLAALPPAAFRRLKRLMRGDAEAALHLEAEAQAQAECIVSSEFAEGYAAFREKRRPLF